MAEALDTAAEFRFIRTVSVYGTAILPLLEKLDKYRPHVVILAEL